MDKPCPQVLVVSMIAQQHSSFLLVGSVCINISIINSIRSGLYGYCLVIAWQSVMVHGSISLVPPTAESEELFSSQ